MRKQAIALYYGLVKESWVVVAIKDYEVLINHLKEWYCNNRKGLTIKVVGVMKDFEMLQQQGPTATPRRSA